MKVFLVGVLFLSSLLLFFHQTQAQQQNVWLGSLTPSCVVQEVEIFPSGSCVNVIPELPYQSWKCDGNTPLLCSSPGNFSDCSDCLSNDYSNFSSCVDAGDGIIFLGATCHSVSEYPNQGFLGTPLGSLIYADTDCSPSSYQGTVYNLGCQSMTLLGFNSSSPYGYIYCNANGIFLGECPTSNCNSNCNQRQLTLYDRLGEGQGFLQLGKCYDGTVLSCQGSPVVTGASQGSFNNPWNSLAIVFAFIALTILTWV